MGTSHDKCRAIRTNRAPIELAVGSAVLVCIAVSLGRSAYDNYLDGRPSEIGYRDGRRVVSASEAFRWNAAVSGMAVVGAAVCALQAARSWFRYRRHRYRDGLPCSTCPHCLFPRTGLAPGARCPECGFDVAAAVDTKNERDRAAEQNDMRDENR